MLLMVRIFYLLLYTFVGISCHDEHRIQLKEETESIPKQLSKTILRYIDTLINNETSINLHFKPRLDSNLNSDLEKWMIKHEIKISQSDKLMLYRLKQASFDNGYFTAGDTSFLKGDSVSNIVKLYFNGLSFNSDSTKASTVLSVYFGKDIISGWEEIIIFLKEKTGWTINNRWIIVEY